MSRLASWEVIANFVTDLKTAFDSEEIKGKYRPLGRYSRLIDLTTLSHKNAIDDHIAAFNKFCVANREAIKSKSSKALTETTIAYRNRDDNEEKEPNCYIEVQKILTEAEEEKDADFCNVIWNHLRIISAHVDPAGKIKEAIQSSGGDSKEAEFLNKIISKVEESTEGADPSNPMAAVMGMMQTGVFQDLFQGMSEGQADGSLNMGKLMGVVQNMVCPPGEESDPQLAAVSTMLGNMSAGASGGTEGAPNLMNMLGPMLGQMGGGAGGQGGQPDLSGLMGMLGGAMGGAGANTTGGAPDLMGMLGPMVSQMAVGGMENAGQAPPSLADTLEEEFARAKESGKFSSRVEDVSEKDEK